MDEKKMKSDVGVTERIANWVYDMKFEDIPQRIVYEAKTQIMNIIAAIFAGYETDSGQAVLKTASEWGGKEECTIIPCGKRTSLHNTVYVHSAFSMALDYCDYIFPVHTGHSAVVVPLAFVENSGLSGKDFLLAQIIATEVEGRVGGSAIIGVQNGQLCSYVHLIGAACAAAKLMRLNAKKIQNAIGLAMSQPNFDLYAGFMGSDAKVLTASIPTKVGVECAQLAANDLTGTADILEDNEGFCRYFSFAPIMGMYTGLGKTWLTETICYKIYPGCAYLDTVVDCILKLAIEKDIDPDKVHEIRIYANLLTYVMDILSRRFMRGGESTLATLNFSVPYNAAIALIDRELTPRQFTKERTKDLKVWDLVNKVRLYLDLASSIEIMEISPIRLEDIIKETGLPMPKILQFLLTHLNHADRADISKMLSSIFHSPYKRPKRIKWKGNIMEGGFDLSQINLSGYKMPIENRVEIIMEDGKKFVESEEIPLGGAGCSIEEKRKAVEEKFRKEVGKRLGKEKTDEAIEIISKIEEASPYDVRELIRLLCS
jgi:2-methylcitrate dehydratase PrpD